MTEQVTVNRKDDYQAAQRAAFESIQIGRATVEQAVHQGEQLDRAEQIADETSYTLQKAGRVLRGMTWSGWVANKFSKGIGGPPPSADSRREPPSTYEGIMPPPCQPAAQAVVQYRAHVVLLSEGGGCETREQAETLQAVCDTMYQQASQQVEQLQKEHPKLEGYANELATDLAILRKRQAQQSATLVVGGAGGMMDETGSRNAQQRNELLSQQGASLTTKPAAAPGSAVLQEQDDHLTVLSQALGELGHLGKSLNQAVNQQNETIDSLETKTGDILEQSKQVNRRTERLIQKKSWTTTRPVFDCTVTIRHVETGQYLVVAKNTLYLVPKPGSLCTFAVWKRGSFLGLKHEVSSRWVGQSMLGSLTCAATSMGRREEWEIDADNWNATPLLCASAGWGAGGYLHVREASSPSEQHSVYLGGVGVEERAKAAVWCITKQGEDTTLETTPRPSR